MENIPLSPSSGGMIRDETVAARVNTRSEGSKIEQVRASNSEKRASECAALSLNRKQNSRPPAAAAAARLGARRPHPSPFPRATPTPIHHKCNQIVLRAITIRSTPFPVLSLSLKPPDSRHPLSPYARREPEAYPSSCPLTMRSARYFYRGRKMKRLIRLRLRSVSRK